MFLRDVELGDVDAYVRMRCDPAMMAELGGPLPRSGIEAKVHRDVQSAASHREWIKMIVDDSTVAGTVSLFSGEAGSEIGWMVLPEFQGRGIGKQAVRLLLDQAHASGRWGLVHAFPAITNAPSNGICRSLGFTLVDVQNVTFADRLLRTNHWTVLP